MPKCEIIVIGASAGGVEALCELSKNLPKELARRAVRVSLRAFLSTSSCYRICFRAHAGGDFARSGR